MGILSEKYKESVDIADIKYLYDKYMLATSKNKQSMLIAKRLILAIEAREISLASNN
ncbi:MAG TPA: hypothetical protein P5509_08315 [Bacteroidales bacterium]|nr:hypothetical protein [Bacteroidales bacterium]